MRLHVVPDPSQLIQISHLCLLFLPCFILSLYPTLWRKRAGVRLLLALWIQFALLHIQTTKINAAGSRTHCIKISHLCLLFLPCFILSL
jgi:hypothetical protein